MARRLPARLSAVCLILLAGVAAARAASSGAAPTAAASPSTGLVDGQVITVRAAGFAPDTPIQVLECQGTAKHPPKDNHACQGLTLDASGVADGAGKYLNSRTDPTRQTHGYRVHRLPLAIDLQGIHCGPRDPCGLYVGPQEGDFRLPHAFVPITFAGAASGGGSTWPWIGLGAIVFAGVVGVAVLGRRGRSLRQGAAR